MRATFIISDGIFAGFGLMGLAGLIVAGDVNAFSHCGPALHGIGIATGLGSLYRFWCSLDEVLP